MIAVIIPYHQRERGLLRRSIASVFNQTVMTPLQVYVIDDASPCPPDLDISDLPSAQRDRVTVYRQDNAGPGAARNRGLDAIIDGNTIVAFLDSDDHWSPTHLSNVEDSFASGADFYFADHQREEEALSRFRLSGFAPDGPVLAHHSGAPLQWCDVDTVSRAIVTRSPVGTSTVATRRAFIGPTRFPDWLRGAGEDTLFWLSLLRRHPRVVCCVGLDAHYGRGVSVFNHRSWGDDRSMRTILDEMYTQLQMQTQFAHDTELNDIILTQCARLDRSFCAAFLACIRRGHWRCLRLAHQYLGARPQAILKLPAVVASAIRQTICSPRSVHPSQPSSSTFDNLPGPLRTTTGLTQTPRIADRQ